MTPTSFAELARDVVAATPALGSVRLVVVDGPAGSGKTTFAERLAAAVGGTRVLHMDDFYEGWSGALTGDVWRRLDQQVLRPLAAGGDGSYRRYDWAEGAFAQTPTVVPTAAVVVLEGVGSAARPIDPFASLRVWVEAPEDVRIARGIERDGEHLRREWIRWLDVERAHFATDRTRERADLVVDGSSPDGQTSSFLVFEDRR